MKTGIIDVGGGIRGIYAAGVLDYCMDNDIRFDLSIGVSAGSANLSSFAARQRGRNYRFYTEYAFRKQYMSMQNYIKKGSYVDLDYVYGTLSNSDGEYPLDYDAFAANPIDFYVVATNAVTGQAKYFTKNDMPRDRYDILKASSSIPFACKPYVIDGVEYFDGALSDPVPVEKAFRLGCDKIVLMLTKPEDLIRTPGKDTKIAAAIRKKYPVAAEKMSQRAQRYNESVALAKRYAEEGKAIIVAPDDTCGLDTLKKDRDAIERLYKKGYNDGQKITDFLQK